MSGRKILDGLLWSLLFVGLFLSRCTTQDHASEAVEDLVEYNGRVGREAKGIAEIYWPGSSLKTKFKGTAVKAILKDERGHNDFNVIIDDDSVYHLRIDSVKKTYTLIDGLPEGEHTVELFRLTDWNNGRTWFYGFDYGPAGKPMAVTPKRRRMEFYGNSITVGAAIEDSVNGLHHNHYLSYAAVTARHYDAAYACIARSGIGLMVSWFSLTMPEMYDRLNPFDSTSVWDFSKATPDLVVVNLLQNDYALSTMPEYDQFKKRFGERPPTAEFIIDSYRNFIKVLRQHYPNAHIVCVLGNMDATSPGSAWPGYIRDAVESLHDNRIYAHFFPYKNTDGHPKVYEHRKMAESLIKFIDDHITW